MAYVRRIPPFDQLSETLYLDAARALEIGLFPAGTRLATAGGEPLRSLFVIRKGAVRLERDGQVLQFLEEGEVFGYTSLIAGHASLDVVVEEDMLAYCLPAQEFERLLADARFAEHFAVGLTERLKASLDRVRVARFEPDVAVEVEHLVRRPAVWLGPEATVRDAARLMRDEHISSVLLRCEPPGIVTDRDLRNRVLGEDLGPEIPVARVCSHPLRTVDAATPLYEAWRTLLDAGVNHLPVVRDGAVVGVLTSTDLLRHSAQGPIAVLRRFERLTSRAALTGYAAKLTEMASALFAAGLDALAIAGFVAQLNATLLRRLLQLAEADLGPPPAPYAWLVFGSAARREETLPAHQDNGLAYGDEGAGRPDWFQSLAERVNADLEAAGLPASPADRTARGRHAPLAWWVRQIEESAEERPWQTAEYFDFRRAGGTLDTTALEVALAHVSGKRLFMRAVARQALAAEPPAMLLLRLRRASSRVDLERHGILPVVSLARCLAIEVRSRARNTVDRLDDAVKGRILSERTQATVAETFRFLLRLLLSVQLRAVAAGRPPANEVALSELTGIERTRLKDAFRVIRSWQQSAAYHYQEYLM